MYHYYNANPKDRRTDDCVIRAIALATEQSWDDVLVGLTKCALENKYMISCPECYGKYLKKLGWVKQKQPVKRNNKKYRACEFAKKFNGVAIAHVGTQHIACIKENEVWDIWDSSDGVIGNYWVKEN